MASKKSGGWLESIKTIVYAAAIAIGIRTIAFEPFNIPSGSMIPSLQVGDYLFVSKFSYGYSRHSMPFSPNLFEGRIFASPPKRGDVAVFKLPRDGSTDYIKRVIGMPGDKVQLVQGRLLINGAVVPREPVQKMRTRDAFGREVDVATYKETLPGGSSHLIIERDGDTGYYDNTKEHIVPAGHYFMMGDNRDNSTDSRVGKDEGGVGPVPLENFVGRAEVIFFSVEEGDAAWQFWKWPWSVRWSRLFQPVR
jgi:signal peptidase I